VTAPRPDERPPACPTPRKLCYQSRREALQATRVMKSGLKGQLRPYRCACGNWHLSSMGRRQHKAAIRRRGTA
jgi:hypothetical protein